MLSTVARTQDAAVCVCVQGYARRIASESLDASAGFTVDLALKDVRYMRQLAEMSRCPLRVAGAAWWGVAWLGGGC